MDTAKKSTWKTFQKHAVLLHHFGRGALSEATEELICRVYSSCIKDAAINKVRYRLFKKEKKNREKLPPTQSCLSKHIQRAHYRSRVWYLADSTSPDYVSPINNGWYKDPTSGQLHPQLMVEDPLRQEFSDIVYGKYKNRAIARCTCRSKQLKCTGACSCSDDICRNPFTTKDDEESDSLSVTRVLIMSIFTYNELYALICSDWAGMGAISCSRK